MKRTTLTLLIWTLGLAVFAQKRQGETVRDFPMKKVINAGYTSSTFNTIKKDLTIIDFFGTWCIPCIKALPHLSAIQEKYGDRLRIVLVSIEEEHKLQKFISARNNFPFPLVVDGDNTLTTLFEPPSYPYSVVLNNRGQIMATLTDAAQLTDAAIARWLDNPTRSVAPAMESAVIKSAALKPLEKSANPAVQLSQDFLYAAKTGEPTDAFERNLASMDFNILKERLRTDNDKAAFWINLYNAFTNTILKKDPAKYKDRKAFFGADQVAVAGKRFSLDDIEHGFLRRSRTKWSLGYIGKLFPSTTEKELRVDRPDYRVHFALNCGAKSCPPIAYYSPERLDQQLEQATKNYLTSEATYNEGKNHIQLPAIMGWFRADFGGKKGMRAILKKHGIIQPGVSPKISFKSYNWDLYLDNYSEG